MAVKALLVLMPSGRQALLCNHSGTQLSKEVDIE
jgi:hypothetical protein